MRRQMAGRLLVLGCAAAVLLGGLPVSAGASPADTQDVSTATAAAEARIARLLPARMSTRTLGSRVGVLVEDAASGRDVVGARALRPFMPASNLKLVTAVAVLTARGPDARFRTTVVRGDGPHEVVLVGGGDPLLTSGDLADLAREVVVARRTGALPPGRVVLRLDDSLFPAPTAAPGWRSDYQPYTVSPVRSLGRLYDYSSDTAANAARYVVERLRSAGLKATYGGRTDAPTGTATLGVVDDHSVRDAVRLMLLVSENNVAEVLFRHVALAAGVAPTWAGSSAATTAVLRRLGVPLDGVVVADGSGASRADRLTPVAVTAVLRAAVATGPAAAASDLLRAGPAGRGPNRHAEHQPGPLRHATEQLRGREGPGQDRHPDRGHRAVRCHHRDGRQAEGLLLPRQRPPDHGQRADHAPGARRAGRDRHRLLVSSTGG